MTRKRALAIAAGIALLGVAAFAEARPGGGGSYSGGGGFSSSSGGGSSGGGGGGGGIGLIIDIIRLIIWLIELIVVYPYIGIPLVLLLLGLFIWSAYKQHHNKDWDSGPPVVLRQAVSLDAIRTQDEDFSQPVFEDFAFRLYAALHLARPDRLDTLAPYATGHVRRALAARKDRPATAVVIGAMRVVGVAVPIDERPTTVELEFEANLASPEGTLFVVESWTLERAHGVKSRPPKHTRIFPCPNCGAPWAAADTGTQVCQSCNQAVDNGRFDWVVVDVVLRSSDERGKTLLQNVEERGNDLPTIRAQNVDQQVQKLVAVDPEATPSSIEARVRLIYKELYAAWANNDLAPARGLVTDGLYDYLQYWIGMYKAQGLRNALDDMKIATLAIAKVTRDKYYQAVTIRVFACGYDYVVDREGKIVSGSKSKTRDYTEYWTLIRTAAKKGATKIEPVCGNCGAPIEIDQAGECIHCRAHVTAGEFDWVLSKIEQDDSYRG